jgi:hypothetical protein
VSAPATLWVPVIRFMSCDLRVLMDQPTEPIPSGQPFQPTGQPVIRRTQAVGLPQGAVRAVAVVMVGLLGQHPPQLPAAEESIRSSSSRRTVPIHRSASALARGVRTGVRSTLPAAADQIVMPAQQRLGPDGQPVPARARQQPGESGQHRTVSPVQSGSGHLPAEHRNLVPQHQQLRVVGRRGPCQQHQPSQQVAEDQIEQSKRHPLIIGASVSLSEVAGQSLRPTFWHPQVLDADDGAHPGGEADPAADWNRFSPNSRHFSWPWR